MSTDTGVIHSDKQGAEVTNFSWTDDWGITTTIKEDVDTIAVHRTQDVAPILEANNEDYNSGHNGNVKGGWGRHVARIPIEVAAEWATKYGVCVWNKNHAPAMARLLNSNEWRYLRTAPGQIGLKAR